jgi:hypothetical protein
MRDSSEILKQLFDRDIVTDGEGWIKLVSSWEEIVGTDLSAHIRVKDLQNGTLLLDCDHPGWAQIFYMKKSAVMGKLNKYKSRHFPQMVINNFRVICENKSINNQLVDNGRIIEEYHERVEHDGNDEIPKEFTDLLSKLRKLGN